MNRDLPCVGVVLAGGASTRMGQDKALLPLANGNLLTHTQNILHNAGIKDIVVSGDRHQVADLYPGQGPVSGILSVIEQFRPKALVILPVDMPLLTSEIIKNLIFKGQLSQQAAYYQGHYLPLYFPVNAFTEMAVQQVKQQMAANKLTANNAKGPAIKALLSKVPKQVLNIRDERLLLNANTPEQWQLAQHQLNKRNKHEQFNI